MDTQELLEILIKRIEALAVEKGERDEQILNMADEIVDLKNKHKSEVSILEARIKALEGGEGDCFVLTTQKKEE